MLLVKGKGQIYQDNNGVWVSALKTELYSANLIHGS